MVLPIVNINKSRLRKVFWRTDGDGKWVQTLPLPADPIEEAKYLAKGFRLSPPGKVEAVASCPFCDYTNENPRGMRTHMSVHVSKNEDKEETNELS